MLADVCESTCKISSLFMSALCEFGYFEDVANTVLALEGDVLEKWSRREAVQVILEEIGKPSGSSVLKNTVSILMKVGINSFMTKGQEFAKSKNSLLQPFTFRTIETRL